MKIGIVGTKKFNNYRLLTNIINEIIKKGQLSSIELFSFKEFGYNVRTNSTFGVNYLLKKYSELHQYPLKFIETEWNNFDDPEAQEKESNGRIYNAKAPIARNKKILNQIDFLIVLHKEEYDLKDLISKAKDREIVVFEFNFKKLIKNN